MINDIGFRTIVEKLTKKGFVCYAVGGCVRDVLLGKISNDVDLCTNAKPEEVKEVFNADYRVIETGIKHGTVSVLVEGKLYEITTFRTEVGYSDFRHPDKIEFVSELKEDLSRRDFTVNAMACDVNGNVIDYFNGKEDLKNKIIRCVGDPNVRFKEDALRILRALRFASVLGFSIEEETAKAIINNKNLLLTVSAERIYTEFTKLLLGDNVESILEEFSPVIFTLFPEMQACYKFEQKSRYHKYDVYKHIINAVANAKKNVVIRYAMFFHDVGKPACFSIDDNGVGHFYNHQTESVKIAKTAFKRLKPDSKTYATVLTLIEYHDTMMRLTNSGIKKWLRILGVENFRLVLEVQKADAKAHADGVREVRLSQVEKATEILSEILHKHECYNLKALAVSGYDLSSLGYKGSEIGKCLEILLDKVICGDLQNDKIKLIDYAQKIKKEN